MNRQTAHNHHHAPADFSRAFAVGVVLNGAFVCIELFFGFISGSLALLTDAIHNLGDVIGLLLAWAAATLARRKPSLYRTYGYSRATILASLFSGLLLMGAVGAIGWEAINRLMNPVQPAGLTIVVVAAIGVVINSVTALFFFRGKDHDLNIRGAYLHMAADAAVSLGVVVSGLLIWKFGWPVMDPLISLVIAVVILLSTWGLLRDSLNLAVDAVPKGVDPEALRSYLCSLRGVREVHDLHIWPMSTTKTALTVHLVMMALPEDNHFLHDTAHELQHRFHIDHVTIQFEVEDDTVICHQSKTCVS